MKSFPRTLIFSLKSKRLYWLTKGKARSHWESDLGEIFRSLALACLCASICDSGLLKLQRPLDFGSAVLILLGNPNFRVG